MFIGQWATGTDQVIGDENRQEDGAQCEQKAEQDLGMRRSDAVIVTRRRARLGRSWTLHPIEALQHRNRTVTDLL